MTDFDKKVKKFEKLIDTAWNYMYGLKDPRFTEGWWTRYGYRAEDQLRDLQKNHWEMWKTYCKSINRFPDVDVEDLFC